MKIIDENGAAIENPDLTLGYLVDDTEPVEHPAVEGVEEVSHYETVTEYPGGGRDVRKVIDAIRKKNWPRGKKSASRPRKQPVCPRRSPA